MLSEIARFWDTRLGILSGDITEFRGDALVNAANSGLLGGGGVDGAIHRAAGPSLLEACKALRAGPLREGLAAGRAVATPAGDLAVRRVIHTVGPIWQGGDYGEPETLASCYAAVLALAETESLESIAIPAISTGAYGYPKPLALQIALAACRRFISAHALPQRVDLVFYRRNEAEEAVTTLAKIFDPAPSSP